MCICRSTKPEAMWVHLLYTFSVSSYARLVGLTVTLVKNPVFQNVALYHWASISLASPHGTYCLLLQVQAIFLLGLLDPQDKGHYGPSKHYKLQPQRNSIILQTASLLLLRMRLQWSKGHCHWWCSKIMCNIDCFHKLGSNHTLES